MDAKYPPDEGVPEQTESHAVSSQPRVPPPAAPPAVPLAVPLAAPPPILAEVKQQSQPPPKPPPPASPPPVREGKQSQPPPPPGLPRQISAAPPHELPLRSEPADDEKFHDTTHNAVDLIARHKQNAMQEQEDRRRRLTHQKQLIAVSTESDNKNFQKCHERYNVMLQRMDVARQTADELRIFLLDRTRIIHTHETALRGTKTSYAVKETGTLRQAAISSDLLRKNTYDHHVEMTDRVYKTTVEKSAKYAKDMQARFLFLKAEGDRISKALQDSQRQLDEAWFQYEVAMNGCLKLEAQGNAPEIDPFLSGRIYDQAAMNYRKTQDLYSQQMNKLFREVKIADGRRIDEMKVILLDHFLAEKAISENKVKLLDNSIQYIKAIDREKDVQQFVNEGEFIQNDAGKTIFETVPQNNAEEVTKMIYQDIQRSGGLFRQGRVFSGRWKPIHAIVSRGGFFHYFDTRDSLKPTLSINLADVDINLKKDIGDGVFEIAIPNSSFFSLTGNPTRYIFKADSEEDMVEWICAMSKHIRQ